MHVQQLIAAFLQQLEKEDTTGFLEAKSGKRGEIGALIGGTYVHPELFVHLVMFTFPKLGSRLARQLYKVGVKS